jgi:hypothetical protein
MAASRKFHGKELDLNNSCKSGLVKVLDLELKLACKYLYQVLRSNVTAIPSGHEAMPLQGEFSLLVFECHRELKRLMRYRAMAFERIAFRK